MRQDQSDVAPTSGASESAYWQGLAAILFGCLMATASGQPADTGTGSRIEPRKIVRNCGVQYGVPSGVNAIEQTHDGYLWVGTFAGLYRFDGTNFKRYPGACADFCVSGIWVTAEGSTPRTAS